MRWQAVVVLLVALVVVLVVVVVVVIVVVAISSLATAQIGAATSDRRLHDRGIFLGGAGCLPRERRTSVGKGS